MPAQVSAPQPSPSARHVPALDGVRGLAIILVMLQHFNLMGEGVAFDRLLGNLAGSLWVGVDLFFVLSGFLITGILVDAKETENYFHNFYVRRVLRIFPLYYGFLVVLIFVMPRALSGYSQQVHMLLSHQGWLWTYTTNILLAIQQNWNNGVPSANHFWSLAVEEQFYLLWPTVVFVCSRKQLSRVCIALVFVAPALRILLLARGDNYIGAYVLTPARMDSLAMGALVALAVRERATVTRALRWSKAALIISGLLIAAAFAIAGSFSQTSLFVRTAGYSVIAVFFGAMLLRTVAYSEGMANRAFSNSGLQAFGRYSYGLYVIHPAVRRLFVDRVLPHFQILTISGSQLPKQLLFFVVAFAFAFGLAWLSWHAYEKHFLKLKDYFPYGGSKAIRLESKQSVAAG